MLKFNEVKSLFLKEVTKEKARYYHICDPYDIEQIKAFDFDRPKQFTLASSHNTDAFKQVDED